MPDDTRLKTEELGSLYPKAKTYEERRAEREALNALHESRKPKLVPLRASLLLTLGFAFILVLVWFVPVAFSFNIMAGAFISMGALMILVWYLKSLVSRVIYYYEVNGHNFQLFFVAYPLFLGCFIVVQYLLYGWEFMTRTPLPIAATAEHFFLTLCLAWALWELGRE